MIDKKAVECLIKADLSLGYDNRKAIKEHLEKEQYEYLAVIKKVFDENGKKLPLK